MDKITSKHHAKRNRKACIDHIEAELFAYILDLKKNNRSFNIKNKIVMKKAEELCPIFSSKGLNAKQMLIKRFMKKIKPKLPPPPRKCSKNPQFNKCLPCEDRNCNSTATCRRKQNCPIQRIINHSYKAVSVIVSDDKGKSLILEEICRKNDFVIEYCGRSIPPKVGEYVMKLGPNKYIDGNIKGNFAKYINHSCDPNCELHIVRVDDNDHACLFANKYIRKGQELTFDYKWDKKKDGKYTTCYCGEAKCRGTIEIK